jgi:hypothetical protein
MTPQTVTRDEAIASLEKFANMGKTPDDGMMQIVGPSPSAGLPAVFGAQAVAVHRDEAKVLAKLKVLASAAGDDWYYRFPVKDTKTGTTQWIEGPSIKLANDLARMYGNCEVDCRAQDMGTAILFHARFVDLETGFALTRPFQQRKGASKLGGSDAGRRDDITFQIGASKAIRNVVVNALQTFADFAFAEAKEALVDKIGKDIVKWRDRTIERMGAQIDIKRVEAAIGRPSKDWLAGDIARIIAMGKAIADGMATWDETFPQIGAVADQTKTADALDSFAAGEVKTDAPQVRRTTEGTEAAAAADVSSDQAAAADNPKLQIINRMLELASGGRSESDKLEGLDLMLNDLVDQYPRIPNGFIKDCATVAAKVARGEQPEHAARKYLEGKL